ncbi:SGNH/GDSL hydrolase family protein [Kiritimatiella glycovorans]|uniref:GDSL-like Lipase/Acylhydrolase n=1 Tax=Kiritimatiella glycovorans TaxID=1307763 RepID=A0A0G3EKC7_9BACT|nr:SGNH/GDSL hydrolase family protein [Kiritimatiella glycovorans]AKJ64629.1 GDSL-like Lipase/Acylhydrolase [Kiritimatiella glycovorans]
MSGARRTVVLFQGDSITDADRVRTVPGDLGRGYAMIVAGLWGSRNPEQNVQFLNRGVGGDRVRDLVARWDHDTLSLRPDAVSILAGINDTWRRFDSGEKTIPERFEREYRELIGRTREKTGARIILCEPFVLPVRVGQKRWLKDLDPKREIVRALAESEGLSLVPLQERFRDAEKRREASFWLPDGVHPSPAGHALIARAWLEVWSAASSD